MRILHTDDHPFLRAKEGKEFLRDGEKRVWRMNDLQSFTPLRFMPPEAMGYQGRAIVIDPDVFAVGDIWELLSRDMQGKAILCRPRSGTKGAEGGLATSVMLLDCSKLQHWRCEERLRGPVPLRARLRRLDHAQARAARDHRAVRDTSGTTSTI